jgi:Protein of unknown function (DUF3108)
MWRQAGLRWAVAALFATSAGVPAANADTRLEARYTASLAGIPIGSGTWMIDIGETHYVAAASGSTSGLLRVFVGGQGTSAARGSILAGKLVPSAYAASIRTIDSSTAVRLTLADGNVKTSEVEPPIDHDPERLPLTRAHEQGVLDPMTATLLRMAGVGNPVSAEACNRTLSVFDGRLRYDLTLAYKRMDAVHAQKGYSGPAVVCSVAFSPIAGHIPSRAAIKYLAKQKEIEIWLVPIAGTRVLVPFRAEGPTPIGKAVLQATQFETAPAPTHAAAEKAK